MPPELTKFEPKRILVGTDFSECSLAALRLSDEIAAKFSATLTVLHAIPPHASASPLLRHVLLPPRTESLDAIENELVVFIRSVIGRKPMPQYRIIEGHAAEAVLFAAGYESMDMIVLGTRGRGGLDRLTLGSVAERILRLASVPVLTICPRRATKRWLAWSYKVCPVTSEGMRSGVNWMRVARPPNVRASACTSSVLPNPGTPSISTCPAASSAASTCSTTTSWPITAFAISAFSARTAWMAC